MILCLHAICPQGDVILSHYTPKNVIFIEVGHVIFSLDVVWDGCSKSDSNLLES